MKKSLTEYMAALTDDRTPALMMPEASGPCIQSKGLPFPAVEKVDDKNEWRTFDDAIRDDSILTIY